MAGSDRVCGCQVVTAAGVAFSLQLFVLAIGLSSTGLLADRYYFWLFANSTIRSAMPTNASANATQLPNEWAEGLMELGIAWWLGYGAFWFVSLFVLLLSFKYYRPVFVVPNYAALAVGFIANLVLFAILLARLLNVSKPYRIVSVAHVVVVVVCALSLIFALLCLCFLACISKYHSYLVLRYGHQVPKFAQSRPAVTMTPYNDGGLGGGVY